MPSDSSTLSSAMSVKLVGVEAGGRGPALGEHAARFSGGVPGVLQGTYSYLLQNDDGRSLTPGFGRADMPP
jgi:tryptophan synthase beta subunit